MQTLRLFAMEHTMTEIQLEGLNCRQQVLADIMWSIEEWKDVERFIAALPARERIECKGIVEMMRIELMESYQNSTDIENTSEAAREIARIMREQQ
jgi:hypothetical protein